MPSYYCRQTFLGLTFSDTWNGSLSDTKSGDGLFLGEDILVCFQGRAGHPEVALQSTCLKPEL